MNKFTFNRVGEAECAVSFEGRYIEHLGERYDFPHVDAGHLVAAGHATDDYTEMVLAGDPVGEVLCEVTVLEQVGQRVVARLLTLAYQPG